MSPTIPEHLIAQLSEFINAKTGLYFPKERWAELRRTVRSVAQELSKKHKTDDDPISCIEGLLSDRLTEYHMNTLIRHLTIGETYFFRDKHLFHVLKENIIPELIRLRQHKEKCLRFWSAACCTGEEPYSLAMLIDQLLPNWQMWNITLLATDLNATFLQKAGKGIYKEWSFRDTPEDIKKKYFEKKDERHFEFSPRLKTMVTFCQMNLSENSYPLKHNNTNDMDIIICRNVLMYFDPELRKQIVHRFTRSLLKGGWMILNPGDAPSARHPDLYPFRFPQIILYRKKTELFQKQNIESKTRHTDNLGIKKEPFLVSKNVTSPSALMAESSDIRILNKKSQQEPQSLSSPQTFEIPKDSDGGAVWNLYQKAMKFANQGELGKAEKCCKETLHLEKLHSGCHYLLATICQEQGRLRESARSFKHALFLDPKFILAHFALGNLMHREGRVSEAKKHLNNALSLLAPMDHETVLPYSEGMTAGRLRTVIQSMLDNYE